MNKDIPHKSLSEKVLELLAKAAARPEWEVLAQFEGGATARLLGIEEQESQGQRRVSIASDGLGLEIKAELETYLLSELSSAESPILIYFKRLKSLADRIKPDGTTSPRPSEGNQMGPFGTRRRLRAIPGVCNIVAVSSGKGGVGKSTVAVNLAVGLALAGQKVGLLDTDVYGPSVPMLLGLEGVMPISANQKMIPLSKYDVKVVSFGFMTNAYHPVIWRGPMVAKALEQFFYQVEWGDLDTLILDLPPGTGDVQLTIIENLPLTGGIVVSTPQSVALLDAHKGLSMFEKLKVPVLGLVENMSHFQCGHCGHVEDVFGREHIEHFSRERQVSILAHIPLHRRIRQAADEGIPLVVGDPDLGQYYLPLVEAVMMACQKNDTVGV